MCYEMQCKIIVVLHKRNFLIVFFMLNLPFFPFDIIKVISSIFWKKVHSNFDYRKIVYLIFCRIERKKQYLKMIKVLSDNSGAEIVSIAVWVLIFLLCAIHSYKLMYLKIATSMLFKTKLWFVLNTSWFSFVLAILLSYVKSKSHIIIRCHQCHIKITFCIS